MTDVAAAAEAVLSERIGELVRAVPGVETLYPSRSVVVAVADAAIGAVITVADATVGTVVRVREQRHPVTIAGSDSGLTVSAVIGVGAETAATVLCRRVYDTIAAYLNTAGLPIAAIEVRVGSIG